MKTLKILAAVVVLLSTTAAYSGCQQKTAPCIMGSGKSQHGVNRVELVWDAAARPFVASGYAKDTLSANVLHFDEIVTANEPYLGEIFYSKGCVINIMVRISNEGKSGKAYVKIKDGNANVCEKREEFVRSLRCDLTTNR